LLRLRRPRPPKSRSKNSLMRAMNESCAGSAALALFMAFALAWAANGSGCRRFSAILATRLHRPQFWLLKLLAGAVRSARHDAAISFKVDAAAGTVSALTQTGGKFHGAGQRPHQSVFQMARFVHELPLTVSVDSDQRPLAAFYGEKVAAGTQTRAKRDGPRAAACRRVSAK
jgi:hypothetical protein